MAVDSATSTRAASPRSASRATIRTLALLADNPRAISKPIPELAPVTRQVFPIIEASRELTGGIVATGVVALGVLEGLSPMVGSDALEEAVAQLAPARHRATNLAALARGLEMAASR